MKRRNNIFEVLLDAVCCVMCADKKVTTREREAVHRILEKLKSPWARNEIDRRIDVFINRAKKEGLTSLVQETCHKLVIFKRKGKEQVLLRCVDYMAKADGIIDPRETELCQKFKTVLADAVEEVLIERTPHIQKYENTRRIDGYKDDGSSERHEDQGILDAQKDSNSTEQIKSELKRLKKRAGAKWKLVQFIYGFFTITLASLALAILILIGYFAYLAGRETISRTGTILGWIVGFLAFILGSAIFGKISPFPRLEAGLERWKASLFPEIHHLKKHVTEAKARLARVKAEELNERGIECFRTQRIRKRTGTAGRPPQIREAIKYFRKAMSVGDSWAVPYMNLGRCFYYCNLLLSGKNLVNMAQERCKAHNDPQNDMRVARDAQNLIEEVIACGAKWFELDFIIDPNSFISSRPLSSQTSSPP